MKKEIWKSVEGYEGIYEVSNMGRARSLPKKWVCGNNNNNFYHDGKILKTSPNSEGYINIFLYKNGKRKTYKLHRIVAIAFIDNPNKYPLVDHINGIRHDNYIDNLRWCTNRQNSSFDNRNIKKTSKYAGVSIHLPTNKWRARIVINKKEIHLGLFNSQEDALESYENAKKNLLKTLF
jgi:hypothetical protein